MADRMRADKLTFNKSGSVGIELALYDYAMQTGDWSAFDRYVDENYDSSADFWLVKLDGTVVGTENDPRIWREIVGEDGKVTKELVPGSDETGSQAASLVSLLGEDRILQRLGLTGENAMNINNYDDQTLKDVLGWNDAQIKAARNNGTALAVDDIQRQKLLGEAMLKQNGYIWDDSKQTWTGTGINIADVSAYGNVAIIRQDGAYLPYTITSMIYRDADAQKLYTYNSQTDSWENNDDYKDNTDVFVYYRNLITGETQRYEFEGSLNFVDNLDGTNYGANQAYDHPTLGTIQGATVAGGRMNMSIANSRNYGEVLLFSNFTDLKGDYFGATGTRAGILDDPRTLYHKTVSGLSDSCLVSFDRNDPDLGGTYFTNNMNYLKNIFKLYRGYSIGTTLIDWNSNAAPGGGSRAKEYKE
jgi:hypothetical protein